MPINEADATPIVYLKDMSSVVSARNKIDVKPKLCAKSLTIYH